MVASGPTAQAAPSRTAMALRSRSPVRVQCAPWSVLTSSPPVPTVRSVLRSRNATAERNPPGGPAARFHVAPWSSVIVVVPTDNNKDASQASDRERSPGRIVFCDGRVRDRPGAAEIGRMKDSRGTLACDEVDVAIAVDGEAGTARGEGSFVGEGWGHRVTREFFPVLAIARAD